MFKGINPARVVDRGEGHLLLAGMGLLGGEIESCRCLLSIRLMWGESLGPKNRTWIGFAPYK